MEIINKKISELIPYKDNPRNNDSAVKYVAQSIKEFGFKVPIIIDKNNVIVAGHTRLKASKQLGLKEVPCIIADDLSEEQIKAFRLADNKVSEQASWDELLLNNELNDIINIDMSEFGFDLDLPDIKNDIDYAESTQEKVENILNLGKANYYGVGKYDIPEILPTYELPEIKEWIGFNYVLSDKDPTGKAVHFFIDDYQFERIWNNIDAYVDKLKQYVCVLSPDFSPYSDMPLATQIFNHYRKHWVGRYLQEQGVTVIPTIRASMDERSYEYYLDGEPKESIVCISSMWATTSDEIYKAFLKEYNTMYETLKPTKIFVYGKHIDGLQGNIEYIDSFAESRWKNAKE